MFTTKLSAAGLLCATSLLVAAPIASGTTATPVAASDTAGLSSGSSQINLGCLLDTLSGGGRTADCNPPTIPVG